MSTVSAEFVAALKDAAVFAPELPEQAAFATLERLTEYERSITVPGQGRDPYLLDYIEGTARYDDELAVYGPNDGATLVSADHATDPFKKSLNEGAGGYIRGDHGTGSLAHLLSERDAATSVIPLGRQTWNVAVAPDDHPIKQKIGELLPGKRGFMSLHGMLPGKLLDLGDRTEIHALLGLGATPNEESREAAETIVKAAGELGLRVMIGNDTMYKIYNKATGAYKLDEETGRPKEGQLKAHRVEMTTNFAYRVMEQTGQQIPSMQLELTRLLRVLPADLEGGWHVDRKARAMGVHLGYLLASAAVQSLQETGSSDI